MLTASVRGASHLSNNTETPVQYLIGTSLQPTGRENSRLRPICRLMNLTWPRKQANWKGEVEDQVVMKLARLCRQAATIRSWTSFLISAVRATSATRMPSGSDAQKSSGSPPAPFRCAK